MDGKVDFASWITHQYKEISFILGCNVSVVNGVIGGNL
jgi:hypothetical protein